MKPQVAEEHGEYKICTREASYELLINYTSLGLWDDVGISQRLLVSHDLEKLRNNTRELLVAEVDGKFYLWPSRKL